MKLVAKQNRELIMINPQNTQNENEAEKIILQVPEQYEDFNKKIVFITPDGNVWDVITNNEYLINKAITQYEQVDFYIWLTKGDVDFRSITKTLKFYHNEDASDEITPEEISGVNTVVNLLEEEISKVENIDITATKIGSIATITITNKQGETTTVEISDGQNGADGAKGEDGYTPIKGTDYFTNADIQEIVGDVTQNIQPTLNSKQNKLTAGENITIVNDVISATGGSGTTDYTDLTNKPSINNVTLNGNKSLNDLGIQGAITTTNQLSSDLVSDTNNTNKFVTSQEKQTWNNKSDFSGSYNDLTNKPTNVSAFANDVGYLTTHQDISGKENTSNKVTSLSASSTDTQYPSAKCVYDLIGNIESLLQEV